MSSHLTLAALSLCCCLVIHAVYVLFIAPYRNPLSRLAGPPLRWIFTNHLPAVLNPAVSPRVHDVFVQHYGRSVRIRGIGPWDERLLTLDPLSLHYVLKHSTVFEKPWQSRRLITSLIGCGMLSAEGQVHRRQRRVATPAFSVQNMRELVPVVFRKANELRAKWLTLMPDQTASAQVQLDICRWISRATFDVIGLAGFDYDFNAIEDESNELFCAYKEMFEVSISQGGFTRTMFNIYLPAISSLFRDRTMRTVQRCQETIRRVAGRLIQEKKRKILDGEKSGASRDLLSLLIKSNLATDLPADCRISDEDMLHNINTFMFAGSDTSSLSVTWILLLLAQHPSIQDRLRSELFSVAQPGTLSFETLTEEEMQSIYESLSALPYLHNVIREGLRLIPPVHSSIRVATQDTEIPTSYPIHYRNGKVDTETRCLHIPKGTLVHIAIEAFNLDKGIWGEDAWEFRPDRWDSLPEVVQQQPGLFSNLMTFSAGPRSCIGMRFSLIEIKSFLYFLLTHFVFHEADVKIVKANVVLTRPYVVKQFQEGSQCPVLVSCYRQPPSS
ncbi:cytochrome P450 [Pluteus cervinus]|uniref:Cytochrome P450 n=1 Tax=Pluteus cervinus TaxID=181527 RepID=A0ACD3BCB0_9AGAR|nr:cytochrome P450 [Pluteus cervinus]